MVKRFAKEATMKARKLSIVGMMMLVLASSLVLAGCSGASGPQFRTGWIGSSGANEMSYRYTTFTGTEEGTAHVEDGEAMVLAYAAVVNEGTLVLRVQSPEGETLWSTTLTESVDEQQVTVTTSEAGTCRILVTGNRTAGRFAVSWSVR
jgi:hypothetical protein